MRSYPLLALGFLFLADAVAAETIVVTSLGDAAGVCPDPTSCTLRAAISVAQSGDRVEFSPALPQPGILELSGSELMVDQSLTLAGPGAARLTVRAASGRRVLNLMAGTLHVEGLTLDRGRVIGSNGNSGSNGGVGQAGGSASGGCITTADGSTLMLQRVALRDCRAVGGSGGNGGDGVSGVSGSNGAPGGPGGTARGGAVLARGQVILVQSSISESAATGGSGGIGGDGGPGTNTEGEGGTGGPGGGAMGGAIALSGAGAALLVNNSTLTANLAEGGNAGSGGNGGNGSAPGQGRGGTGGAGGLASGGQVHIDSGVALADFEFASLGPSPSQAGAGGLGGSGVPQGNDGLNGAVTGELLLANSPARVRSSVFAGMFAASDCSGMVAVSSDSLLSDGSCPGFAGVVDFITDIDGPGLILEDGRAVLRPLAGAPMIDAASDCLDFNGAAVEVDQSGRGRPIDGGGGPEAVCDIGAIEFTFDIFRDGFEAPL